MCNRAATPGVCLCFVLMWMTFLCSREEGRGDRVEADDAAVGRRFYSSRSYPSVRPPCPQRGSFRGGAVIFCKPCTCCGFLLRWVHKRGVKKTLLVVFCCLRSRLVPALPFLMAVWYFASPTWQCSFALPFFTVFLREEFRLDASIAWEGRGPSSGVEVPAYLVFLCLWSSSTSPINCTQRRLSCLAVLR